MRTKNKHLREVVHNQQQSTNPKCNRSDLAVVVTQISMRTKNKYLHEVVYNQQQSTFL